jgi:hypothetical protein
MQSKNDEEFHQKERLRKKAKQQEQAKRTGAVLADIDAQYVRLMQEVSATGERADNLLRNGALGPHPSVALLEEGEQSRAARKTRALQFNNPFLQDKADERERQADERERLRAEREREGQRAERTTPVPTPQWPTGNPDYITVEEAGHLLATGRPPSLYGKPNDTGIRSDVIKSFTPYDIMTEILRWAQDGRVHLFHPTLIIIIRHPDDLDENWGMRQEMFEHIRNALANGHEPAVLPAIDGGDGEVAASVDQALSTGTEPVAKAGSDCSAKAADEQISNALRGAAASLTVEAQGASVEIPDAAEMHPAADTTTDQEETAAQQPPAAESAGGNPRPETVRTGMRGPLPERRQGIERAMQARYTPEQLRSTKNEVLLTEFGSSLSTVRKAKVNVLKSGWARSSF